MSRLEMMDVHCNFGRVAVLKGVTLTVPSGERHVLIGPNGAGKSTLVNVIAGTVRLSAGEVRLNGMGISHMPIFQRARMGISRTFQHSQVFDGLTVRESLGLAMAAGMGTHFQLARPWEADGERLGEIAEQVGLSNVMNISVGALSHGVRRQVEIGMALLTDGTLLLLDEPAAGLSPAERPRLVDILTSLPKTITILMIEHDMTVAMSVADKVSVLSNGGLIASGFPDEIRSDTNVQRVYLGGAAV